MTRTEEKKKNCRGIRFRPVLNEVKSSKEGLTLKPSALETLYGG